MSDSEGFDPVYTLLRNLTLPVVAITASAVGRRNGLIVNSAQRASLVPSIPRVSLYISKPNFTHDLIYASGVFTLHLLRRDQFELIYYLGMQSGREIDKLKPLDTFTGQTGAPVLKDCVAGFECRVVNAMDTGAATFFLGDVVNVHQGTDGDVMTSEYFREHLPADRLAQYENNLRMAQRFLEGLTRQIDRTRVWPGPTATP